MKTRNSPVKKTIDDAAAAPMTKSSSPRKPPPPLALSGNLDDDVTTTTTAGENKSSKRRKIDFLEQKKTTIPAFNNSPPPPPPAAAAAAITTKASSTKMETIDVANMLGLKPGDRIEVKWNINDDEDDGQPPEATAATGERMGLPKTEGLPVDMEPLPLPLKSNNQINTTDNNNNNDNNNDNNDDDQIIISSNSSSPAPPGMISVWWKATVQKATGEYHILDDAEETAAECGFPPVATATATTGQSTTTTTTTTTVLEDKDQKYNCPKCTKKDMSKQGLYTHYGMVHGGKISRDFPNLLSSQHNHNNTTSSSNSNNNNAASAAAASVSQVEAKYDFHPSRSRYHVERTLLAFKIIDYIVLLCSDVLKLKRKSGNRIISCCRC